MKLILNETKSVNVGGVLQNFVWNLLPKQARLDTMEGREFVVVPMVILTEGVHVGSGGPLFYSKDELGKTPVAWNHKPIVVYHPELNGQGISACSPDVITSRKVGVMMNTTFEGNRLKSEAWIEKGRADLVDNRIMQAIEKNEMMELSTGVFIDEDPVPGEWMGESYTAIARNFRPDHLALLPDKIGACSISDGAGFIRNQHGKTKGAFAHVIEKVLVRMGLTDNELSFSNVRESLNTELRKRFNVKNDIGPSLWVEDVYSNFVIYELKGKLYRLGYTASDTGVTLSDDKESEVVRVTEYRSVNGAFVGNDNGNQIMKKQLIDALIGNKAAVFTEADRPRLEAMTEEQLKRVTILDTEAPKTNATPATPPVVEPLAVVAPTVLPPVANTVVTEPKKPLTLVEYVAQAPAQIQEVLNNGITVYNEEKERLIGELTANANNPYTKEELSNKPLGELRNLAKLAGVGVAQRVANFGGQGFVPVGNEMEQVMEMPTINFGKENKVA